MTPGQNEHCSRSTKACQEHISVAFDHSRAPLIRVTLDYPKNCAFCHGLPDQPKALLATEMFPPPPQLFMAGDGVTDDPAGEVYWKVKNGIRLTGMPAFQASLSDEQMWEVTALVVRADKLPIEAIGVLKPAPSSATNEGTGAPLAAAKEQCYANGGESCRWTRESSHR